MRYRFDRFSQYIGYVVLAAAVAKLLGVPMIMSVVIQALSAIPVVAQPMTMLAAR
jgi:hypothetical protein